VPLYSADFCSFFKVSTDVAVNFVALYITKAEEMQMKRTEMDNFQVARHNVQEKVQERKDKLNRLGITEDDGGGDCLELAVANSSKRKVSEDPESRVRELHQILTEKRELVMAFQRKAAQRDQEIMDCQREAHNLIIQLQRSQPNGNGPSNGHSNGYGNGVAALASAI
jgi:hypothetical protein